MTRDSDNNRLDGVIDVGGWDLSKAGGTYQSVTGKFEMDQHFRAGQTDAGGDQAIKSVTVRSGNSPRDAVVAELSGALITSPATGGWYQGISSSPFQKDTGTILLRVGNEWEEGDVDMGLYAHAGYENGASLDALRALKKAEHGLFFGDSSARTSEATGSGRIVGGVSGRIDYGVVDTRITEGLRAEFVTSASAQVGNDRSHIAGAAFVRIGEDSPYTFHPNLPGTPTQENVGTGLYAGVLLSKPFNDSVTRLQDPNGGVTPTFVIGADVQITDGLTAGISATRDASRYRLEDQDHKTVGTVAVTMTVRF